MKILMYSASYGSVTTTFIRNEVHYLSAKYEFVYVAERIDGDTGTVRTQLIPYREPLFKRKLSWFLWKRDLRCSFKNRKYAKQLNEFIEKEKPDVIHCHFGYEALPLLENIDKGSVIPVFVHFHGYDASQMLRRKSYVRALKAQLLKKNVYPLLVSEKIRTALTAAGINMSNANVLHCGIDLEKFRFTASGKEHEKIIFLQNSSLVEKKGHIYSLQAFALFLKAHPEYRGRIGLVFTGDGARKPELEKLAAGLGLGHCTTFTGSVNHEQLVTLLDKADVFIHHSITAENGDEEGIPTAVMEAMAAGLPVLSTFHAGIPELVQDGINGFLCNEKDVETYAGQIAKIMHWKKLSGNREVIASRFNLVKHNRQLEKYYKEKAGMPA